MVTIYSIPDDLLVKMAHDWLNPREQRYLAMTSTRFHAILPQPLRIQICHSIIQNSNNPNNGNNNSHSECCCLGGELFITSVQQMEKTTTTTTKSTATQLVEGGGRAGVGGGRAAAVTAKTRGGIASPSLPPQLQSFSSTSTSASTSSTSSSSSATQSQQQQEQGGGMLSPTTTATTTPTTSWKQQHNNNHKMSADQRKNRTPTTTGPLDIYSQIWYELEYFLWKFDYELNCPVYLSRQLRQTQPPSLADMTNNDFVVGNGGNGNNNNYNNNEPPRTSPSQYRFTVGYFPRTPTQSWKFIPDDNSHSNRNDDNHEGDEENGTDKDGDQSMLSTTTTPKTVVPSSSFRVAVHPGVPLQLIVSGWQDRPGQVESTEIHKLTPQTRMTHTGRPLWTWHTIAYDMNKQHQKQQQQSTVQADQQQQRSDNPRSDHGSLANDHTVGSFAYTTSHLGRRFDHTPRSENEVFLLFPSSVSSISHSKMASSTTNYYQRKSQPRLVCCDGSECDSPTTNGPYRKRKGDFHPMTLPSTVEVTQTYRLETFAVPDLSDRGAYLLYSPSRWQAQLAPSTLLPKGGGASISRASSTMDELSTPYWYENGRITSVEFSFWVTHGILYFKAHSLYFALAIPVVKIDREFFCDASSSTLGIHSNINHRNSINKAEESEAQPIINLYESYSARWGCIKYYMATAADVGEGCPFNLDVFLRGVTDHADHRVEQIQKDVIAIQMKESCTTVDPSLVKDIPRDDSRIWKFFFSW